MSKAPETIYIDGRHKEWPKNSGVFTVKRCTEHDIAYVEESAAIGLALEVTQLRSVLTQIRRNASVMTAHQIETMARDALEGK